MNQGAGSKYQMITKSKAKDEYLLSDRHLDGARDGLGCIRLPNPNDTKYGDMKLFLRTQESHSHVDNNVLAHVTCGSGR